MQIRITDISTDKVLRALTQLRFGVVVTKCERRHSIQSVSIWTEDDDGDDPATRQACGYEIGLLRCELSSFSRHELVLETNRIPSERLMALLERIAAENR